MQMSHPDWSEDKQPWEALKYHLQKAQCGIETR